VTPAPCLRFARAGLMAGALVAAPALSQSTGGTYALERSVVAGGGGSSAGGAYALSGTIAQPEAHAVSTGGLYQLHGGFWSGASTAPEVAVFADGFEG
jgi:hypothetical protein